MNIATRQLKSFKRPFMHYWGFLSNIVLASAFAILALEAGQFYLGIALAVLFIFEVGNFHHAIKLNIIALIAAMIPFGSGLGSLLLCIKFTGLCSTDMLAYNVLFNVAPPALFAAAFACGSILGCREILLTKTCPFAFLKTIASVLGCLVVLLVLFLPNFNIRYAEAYASQLLTIGSIVSFSLGAIVFYQNSKSLALRSQEDSEE